VSGPETRPQAVVFDLGEVLATPPDLYGALADRAEHNPTSVSNAYWAHRDAYDRGGDSQQFWSGVLTDLGISPTTALVTDLTRIDTEAWTTIRPDAEDLLARLHRARVRIGILSNATVDMAASAPATAWGKYVQDWFFSGLLKIAKPDPKIYHYVTRALSVPARAIVFIDDRQVNVDAAIQAGWNAHLWTSGPDTASLMEDLGLLPS